MKQFICALVVPMLLASCATFDLKQRPEVSLKRFDIDSITLRDVTLLFELELNNPYPIGFKLDDVGLKVSVEGSQLLSTRTKQGVTVSPLGRATTPVKISLVYDTIMRAVRNYSQKEYLDCSIDIDIVIPLPEMLHNIKKNIAFKYTVQKKIPAIKPTVRVVNLEIKKPSMQDISSAISDSSQSGLNPDNVYKIFSEVISGKKPGSLIPSSLDVPLSISFEIEVMNTTRTKLGCQNLNYEFFINGEKIISGETRDVRNDPGRSIIRITNTLSSRALGTAVVRMFTSKEGQYQLSGFSMIKLPDEIKNEPLKLEFNEKGKFNLK